MLTTLLAPRDAAKRLNLSTSRVIQLNREGRLAAIRDSARRRLFEPATAEDFERARDTSRAPGGCETTIAAPLATSLADLLRSLKLAVGEARAHAERLGLALERPVATGRTTAEDLPPVEVAALVDFAPWGAA